MCKVSKCNVPCIIAGDLNINLLNCRTDKHTDEYIKSVLLHGFVPVIFMPTRITSHSATLIDHIYNYGGNNNKHNLKPKSGNLLNDITDHLPNYLLVLRDKTFPLVERPLV